MDEEKKLYEAAKAYRDLNVHYRIGKQPSEALFTRLEKAAKTLSAYEGRLK